MGSVREAQHAGWCRSSASNSSRGGRRSAALLAACLATCVPGVVASKKKPLFEYDDHYVMLNDIGRNEFYRRALARALPACGPDCVVLDVGAGSGLLSMMAAGLGAPHVVALEANPDLAALAEQTIARNREANFPRSNVTVFANLSSKVEVDRMPFGRPADLIVTETFGTMLLGEGAINFVPDARKRLLKEGGIMVPAGGCQYVTLVEIPDFAALTSPGQWGGLNLSEFEMLKDTSYWKATVGASRTAITALSERICVLEVDLNKDTRESIPENRTFRLQAVRPGTVHAVLFDWDVWADAAKTELLSTAPGARNFAGDVAWGWLLQLQEEALEDWTFGPTPNRLAVQPGDWLDLGVDFLARGISARARVRRSPKGDGPAGLAELPEVLPALGQPKRMQGLDRGAVLEATEFLLPLVGDGERHGFYAEALASALAALDKREGNRKPTVLDSSGGGGVPALLSAKRHGLRSLALPRRTDVSKLLRKVAEVNGVSELLDAFAADARDLVEAMLPEGERVDVLVVEPPGTPLAGLSPFGVIPEARKRLLREDGRVVPAGACFKVGLVDSPELAQLFSVPGGRWEEIDLTVWNEEAVRQKVPQRLVPYTRWFGPHSTLEVRWLSEPQCIFTVDLNEYGRAAPNPEEVVLHELAATADGQAHALLGSWEVWADAGGGGARLGAESPYLGRAMTWPRYVQALAAPSSPPGVLEPLPLRRGEVVGLRVTVRQGAGKVTGTVGPEFTLELAEPRDIGKAEL